MANHRAVTLQSGVLTRIIDADVLIVGAGITTAAGGLTISSSSGVTTMSDRVVNSNRVLEKQGADTASAGTFTMPAGNNCVVTGTATINYITVTNNQDGTEINLVFAAAAVITHNAGSVPGGTAAITLFGVASITAQVGDTLTFRLTTRGGVQTWVLVAQSGQGNYNKMTVGGTLLVTGVATLQSDLAVTGNQTVGGNVTITGNLTVNGTTYTTQAETVLIADNHLYLNSGYTSNPAVTGGLVVNYDPTVTTTTVNGVYTAGVNGVSNPTVITTGSATFAASDIIQISTVPPAANDGLYEVLSHSGTTLTIRGVGLTACVEDFTQNQFVSAANNGANIFKVAVSVIRTGTDGNWEVAKGSNTPFVFTDLLVGTASLTVDVPGTSGEALAVGAPVCLDDSSGPKVFRADANGGTERPNCFGINVAAVGGSGSAVTVRVAGEIAIPDAIWDSVPATGDVGKRVYVSENVGLLTMTAPSTTGSTVLRVGHISVGGSGAVRIVVAIGEPIVA